MKLIRAADKKNNLRPAQLTQIRRAEMYCSRAVLIPTVKRLHQLVFPGLAVALLATGCRGWPTNDEQTARSDMAAVAWNTVRPSASRHYRR